MKIRYNFIVLFVHILNLQKILEIDDNKNLGQYFGK
jgi:hypothetical protein